MDQRFLQIGDVARTVHQGPVGGIGQPGGGVAHQRDQNRFRVAFDQCVSDRHPDIGTFGDGFLVCDAGFGDQLQRILVG